MTTTRMPAHGLGWAAAITITMGLGAGYGTQHASVVQDTTAQEPRPECPRAGLAVKIIYKEKVISTIDSIPLSDVATDIPEFHDCQRFMVPRRSWQFWRPKYVYDSLYAIFAAFRLDTFPDSLPSSGTPVATIYSYDGKYKPLGIEPGFNCLIMSGGPGSWQATMLPQPSSRDSSCVASDINVDGPSTPLTVKESPLPPSAPAEVPFGKRNYPPAARWDWDPIHSQQYIGIRCGVAWCEIGPNGFVQSPVYSGPAVTFDAIPGFPVTPAQLHQTTAIKGWYDEQQLDSVTDAGRPVVSSVHGWLFPNPALEHPLLDTYASMPAFRGRWIHVATAVVTGDYKGNLKTGVNRIYLCHETKVPPAVCDGASIPLTQQPVEPFKTALSNCERDPYDGLRWWWKVVPATGMPQYICVKRDDHFKRLEGYRRKYNVSVWIPATARWRWLLNDPGEWGKCPTGCCSGT